MNTRCQWLVAIALPLSFMSPNEAATFSPTQGAETSTVTSETVSIAVSPVARARADLWSLSAVEWQRYESLMSGVRGSISPASISPIEVLGIHARDNAERQKYAERWARVMHEDVERILAFQHAYDDASQRLYPNEPLIADRSATETSEPVPALSVQDRLLLFTAPTCADCDNALSYVLKRLAQVAGIDIYLSGIKTNDTAAVRGWAATHGIPYDQVKTGKITLNFEDGTLVKLGYGAATVPVIMRRRGDAVSALPLGAPR